MDSLEQESSDLADRLIQVTFTFSSFPILCWKKLCLREKDVKNNYDDLPKVSVSSMLCINQLFILNIQDQVTKAEEQERLVLSQDELENARFNITKNY